MCPWGDELCEDSSALQIPSAWPLPLLSSPDTSRRFTSFTERDVREIHLCFLGDVLCQSLPTLCDIVSDCSPPTPLSMGSSRQEYWSGSPFPSPGDLPNPQVEPRSPTLQTDSMLSEATAGEKRGKGQWIPRNQSTQPTNPC